MSQFIPNNVEPINQPQGRVYAVGINPDVLKWARESINWSLQDAADKTKIPLHKLEAAERGKDRVLTFKQLLKIAQQYKRAVSIFYLDEVPKDDFDLPDFRTFDRSNLVSGQVNIEIREIIVDRDLVVEIDPQPDIDYSFVGKFDPETPNKIILNWLMENFPKDHDVISGLRDEKLLYHWRSMFEEKGILVFQFPRHTHFEIQEETTRGFSFSFIPYPIIAINARETPYARIFTLFHEFIHILLNFEGICTPSRQPSKVTIEDKCDQIAAEFLVPSYQLMELIDELKYDINGNLKRGIRDLSNAFKVSYGVIINRLYDLEIIQKSEYHQQMNILPEPSKSRNGSGGGDYTLTWKSRMSPKFLDIVFNAVSYGQMGKAEAMTKMGISSTVFYTLEDLVRGISIRDIRSSGGDTS